MNYLVTFTKTYEEGALAGLPLTNQKLPCPTKQDADRVAGIMRRRPRHKDCQGKMAVWSDIEVLPVAEVEVVTE